MPQVRHVSRGRHGCPYSAGARRARARQLKKDTHVARKAAHFRAKAVHLRAKAVHLRAKAVHLRAKAVHLRAYVLVVCIHFVLNPLSGGEQGGKQDWVAAHTSRSALMASTSVLRANCVRARD